EFSANGWFSDDAIIADWLSKMNQLYSSTPAISPAIRSWLQEGANSSRSALRAAPRASIPGCVLSGQEMIADAHRKRILAHFRKSSLTRVPFRTCRSKVGWHILWPANLDAY